MKYTYPTPFYVLIGELAAEYIITYTWESLHRLVVKSADS